MVNEKKITNEDIDYYNRNIAKPIFSDEEDDEDFEELETEEE